MSCMLTWSELEKVQPVTSKILTNSFKRNRLSHAYLIQGQRGTGKKEIATLIAMTLFCTEKNEIEPCQTCYQCKRILSGNHPDVHWVEPEGQSIKTEQINLLRKEFVYTSLESAARKIYIIKKADTLTVNAANRILKFLEEPDLDITAILLTEHLHSILPTIQSRCQILELRPLDPVSFQKQLTSLEQVTINGYNARFLSALTNNIDEAIQFHSEEKVYKIRDLVFEFIYLLISNENDKYLFIHQKWLALMKDKKELELGLDILLLTFKDILHVKIGRTEETAVFQSTDRIITQAVERFSEKRLLHILKLIVGAKQKLNQNVHPTLVMEQLVLNI